MTISLQSEKHWKVNQMCVFDSLRPTAQRHIESLVRRKKRSPNPSFYLEEIKRTIIYERQRVKSSKNDKKKNQDYKNKDLNSKSKQKT